MNVAGSVTAAARVVAVLAVLAGVLAMHTLSTGHHGDVASASGHLAPAGVAQLGAVAHCEGGCPQDAPADAPHPPVHLLDVCVAILLAVAVALWLRALFGRRIPAWLGVLAGALRAPPTRGQRPGRPCLFALGVLRT